MTPEMTHMEWLSLRKTMLLLLKPDCTNCGTSDGVVLKNCIVMPARWKCESCKLGFLFEPRGKDLNEKKEPVSEVSEA